MKDPNLNPVYLVEIPYFMKDWDFIFEDLSNGRLRSPEISTHVITIIMIVVCGELPKFQYGDPEIPELLRVIYSPAVMRTSLVQAEQYFSSSEVCKRMLELNNEQARKLSMISRMLRLACWNSIISSDIMCSYLLELCITLINGIGHINLLEHDVQESELTDLLGNKDLYTSNSMDSKVIAYALAIAQKNKKLRETHCRGTLGSLRRSVEMKLWGFRDKELREPSYATEAQLLKNIYQVRNNLFHMDLTYNSDVYLMDRNPMGCSQIFMAQEIKFWIWQYIDHVLGKIGEDNLPGIS